MADRLTQLQDCLDDLLTQMYASLNYIQTRHPYGSIPGQPSQAPEPGTNAGDTTHKHDNNPDAATAAPESPPAFTAALHELAQDLILKEQQIEHLIHSLPGLDQSAEQQERRMRELQAELRAVEAERAAKEAQRLDMVRLLGDVVAKVKRVP